MKQLISGFNLIYLNTANTNMIDDSETSRIAKNIEKMSQRYRRHVVSEMEQELSKQSRQAENINILKNKKAQPKIIHSINAECI